MSRFSVLFVCTGNLCRSPTAQEVLRQRSVGIGLAENVRIDSAGTHSPRRGEPPDPRALTHAARRGYVLADRRSRQLTDSDFCSFDLLLAMDYGNMAELRRRCPPEQQYRLRLLTEFCLHTRSPVVPDPYYGNAQGFEHVLDLLEDACDGLLAHIQRQLGCSSSRP